MYINLYAIIAGVIGSLLIVTKMRHPHIKHVRETLEGSVLFKVIDALDFYTGNHALFYDELFPESSKDPFQPLVPSICHPCKEISPYAGHFPPPGKSLGAGAYHILPALCATAGIFLFSAGIYLRKSLRHALRESQRNIVIHSIRIERRASQGANSVLSNLNYAQQDACVPSPSVSVVTWQDHHIFYPTADSVVVAPPMPVAISGPLLRANSLPEPSSRSYQSRAIQSHPTTPLGTHSPPPSKIPSVPKAPAVRIDDDLPYSIPLLPDEPESTFAEESPVVSIELPSPVESDVAAVSYFTSLPFAQDLDTRRSATPTPAPSPSSGDHSPRYPLQIVEPATRPISIVPVSCRRPDWLPSAQYWEAHSRLNALVSHTTADLETTSDTLRIETPIISPNVSDSPASYKLSVPPVRATTSPAQPTTVSSSASHWEHHTSPSHPVESPFVTGRTGADLVLAMSTSMPRVVDLGPRMAGGTQRNSWTRDGGEWVGASGISSIGNMSASPRASSILRQVVAAAAAATDTTPVRSQASSTGSRRRSTSAMAAAVLQNPWRNRAGEHHAGGEAPPVTASRSTGVSPIQTTVRTSVMRRLGPHRGGSTGLGERWVDTADSVERPPMRITRIFGEPAT